MSRRLPRPDHLTGPFENDPVVVLSVYAEADLENVARKLNRNEWKVRETLRNEVSRHGEGLTTDRVCFDRWQTLVGAVDVVYDIFPNDTIMIVSVSV